MERAKRNEYYASILSVVLLLAPQLSFARGMSGGAAGRAGSSSFSSVGSRSAPMVVTRPRVLVPSPLKNLAKAATDKPNDPALRFLLGFHYGYSGRVADAVRELNKLVQLEPKDQLGRKLRDLMADKTHKDNNSATAMAPSSIYVRKDSNGTLHFSNIPADLSYQPSTWHRTQY